MTGYLEMDLPRFLSVLRARRLLVLGIVVAAALLAFGWSVTQPSRYTASADLLFGRTTNADAIITGATADPGTVPERDAATNLALASLDSLAVTVKRGFPTTATAEDLRKAVGVSAQGASDVVTVTAEWDSPRSAATLANAFAAQIVAKRREAAQAEIQRAIDALTARIPPNPRTAATRALRDDLQGKIADLEALKQTTTGNVRIVEGATPNPDRSSPKPVRNAVIAGFVALLLSLFGVVLLARVDGRVDDEDELAALMGTSVLARIPEIGRRRPTHAWASDQNPSFLEAFEFLRLNLQLVSSDRRTHVVAVTSAAQGEGKSTVSAWLARSLALNGEEVMAVDLDLRKPELHAYLNADREPGAGVLDALLASDEGGEEREARALLSDVSAGRSEHKGEHAAGRRQYTDEDVTAGLTELARVGGNARRAARALRDAGRDISESTLRRWKDLHAELYAEIRSARLQGTVVAPNLRLLSGGKHELAAGLIGRGRLQHLFAQLAQDADYVLVDTFPVSTVADASAIAAAADGVILVIDLPQAQRRQLLSAKRQLANANANLIGIVVNRAGVDFPVYHMHEDVPVTSRPART
jgi:Mrp family chromosome partitioning ATPase/capsular polysaccharide biosynthesis protein